MLRRKLDLKGVVTQVLGPKCNERSSTLTGLVSCISVKPRDCFGSSSGGRCGQEQGA
jgi:hypothetical protein